MSFYGRRQIPTRRGNSRAQPRPTSLYSNNQQYKKLQVIVEKLALYANQVKRAFPAPTNAEEISTVKVSLAAASQFVFDAEGAIYRESGVEYMLKTLTVYGLQYLKHPGSGNDEVVAMATKLYDRWTAGCFTLNNTPTVREVPRTVAVNKRETVKSFSLKKSNMGDREATIQKIFRVFGHNGIAIGE
ncbi:uncharacterized protein H6S33_003476 [Morchella sextelata]|uniref:uncharacterized protein n=1 Tax=Morchella sextelata TaxID=1174677 RepID=UPI001D048454|nr:uncharacterized protein H6S33_003476 [Morchella sextelata]KAH0606642.1 hypothetical protein H6S33_003476 [Morchella sextelata]